MHLHQHNVLEYSMNVVIVQKSVCFIRVFECNTLKLAKYSVLFLLPEKFMYKMAIKKYLHKV